ncbi:GntR family transcriptional regulator [Lysinibacillus sp. FSL H8-0500]|uniref:GntR family transcriptional regulator n=1 Tax=Lysinibacillus sp. FSL H8-0500 TaxID=2921393 RepID=UPI003100E558
MKVNIDRKNKTPYYQQLAQQLLLAIAAGNLQHGDQLPSIRDLAGQTNLNYHTVHKSYKELQKKGIITIKPSSKAFVITEKSAEAKSATQQQLSIKIEQLVIEACVLEINKQQLQQVFQENLNKYYTNNKDRKPL